MKINSIILVNTQQTQPNKAISSQEYISSSLKKMPIANLNGMPSATFGRSMIAFGKNTFQQTLEQNYFQLGKNEATGKPYEADEYQLKSAQHIFKGKSVFTVAPTGTGKTAIALYAITKSLEDGEKVFYTSPTKALGNEKYKQFQKIFGEDKVGLMTGDIKINPNAPIVVMTTEICRNMVVGDTFKQSSGQLDGLGSIILDESHTLGDFDRGGVWEQVIMFAPKNVRVHSLSATTGNAEEVNDWMSSLRGEHVLNNVPPEKRHVPLIFENIHVAAKGKSGNPSIDKKLTRGKTIEKPISEKALLLMVEKLKKEDKLSAIFFDLSKRHSLKLLNTFKNSHLDLNTNEDRKEIDKIVAKYRQEGKYIGESLDMEAIQKGYAIHNSGFLPSQKELVEELFQKKLIKVAIATGTLSLGVNMPARSVVILSPNTPAGSESTGKNGKRELTPNEFHQMAGRAGRRGIDTVGYVYTLSTTKDQGARFKSLIHAKPNNIESHFSPDYSFITGYYKSTQNDDLMKEIMSKSLKAYDKDPIIAQGKLQQLMQVIEDKKSILKRFEYITKDNVLSLKGVLLSNLNGYSQIPIIDMIHSQKLSGMTPAELAACVGAFISTDEDAAAKMERLASAVENNESENESLKIEKTDHENLRVNHFLEDFDEYLKDYNEKMSQGTNFQKIAHDVKVPEHLYSWADLNSKSEDSRLNWKSLYNNFKKGTDEGGLFKEVTRTADLLKQISEISDAGLKVVKTVSEELYYTELKNTAQEAIKLISLDEIQGIARKTGASKLRGI